MRRIIMFAILIPYVLIFSLYVSLSGMNFEFEKNILDIITCVTSIFAFSFSIVSIILNWKLSKPKIYFYDQKYVKNTTFPSTSYIRYGNKFYIIKCVGFENISNNKTMILDIFLYKNNRSKTKSINKELKYFCQKIPKQLKLHSSFYYLKEMKNIYKDFRINEMCRIKTYFVFEIPKINNSTNYKLKLYLADSMFASTVNLTVFEKELVTIYKRPAITFQKQKLSLYQFSKMNASNK